MQFAENEVGQKIKAFPDGRAICPNCNSLLIAKCGEFNIWHWAHENSLDCDSWNYEPKTEWHVNWQKLFGDEQSEVFIKRYGKCHRADILTRTRLVIEIQNSPISSTDIYQRESFYEKMIWVINSKEFKHNLILKNYFIDTGKEILFRWVTPYPQESKLSHAITIPPDDDNDQILHALQKCKFKRTFDKEKEVEFWVSEKIGYQQNLPKEIFNAFSSYLLDKKLSSSLDERINYKTNFKWLHLHKTWTKATRPIFLDLNNRYLFWIKTLHENGNGFGEIVSKWKFLKKYRA